MDSLNPETLEIIFAHIPLPELLKSTSRVCKHWNKIISNEKFLYFKKSYYRVINKNKDEHSSLTSTIEEGLQNLGPQNFQVSPEIQIQQNNHMLQLQKCLPYLLKSFSSNEKLKLFKLQDCFSKIIHHPRYVQTQLIYYRLLLC